ncbi:MAG: YigZ family protein [Clostridia bacterium]|nr:YigZ family protein [Clostridia bacterium]
MALRPYRTLLRAASDSFIVNKSRFIGDGCPCETEEEALAFLRSVREKYRDANHHCYAYIIGANSGIMRYSDDGEPGGTAGMPIMEVLKNRGVTNCAVVVTRYFGGVLLGAGGLVRAYTQGAAAALDASGVGTVHPTARYILEVSYPLLGQVDYFLKSEPVIVEDRQYTDSVILTLLVRCRDEEGFAARLTDATEGAVEPIRFEELYHAWGD